MFGFRGRSRLFIGRSNESLKWTSADVVEVIVVERLASVEPDPHLRPGEWPLAA